MNNCVKCSYPIPPGQEVWMRRKSTNKRTPFCSQCAQEVRQAIRSKRTQQPLARPASPSALASVETTVTPAPHQPLTVPDAAVAVTQSSHVIPISGILLLFLITLVGAPLLGGIVAFVGRYIYLIFVFPFVIGAASGFMVAQGVTWGKVRDPLIAAIFGLLLGLSVYGSYRYIEYLLVKSDARAEIMEAMEAELEWSDSAIADEVFDEILLEKTGKTGFLGVVLLDAQEGLSISRTSSGVSFNIGTALTWVYWLFEIAVFAGVSASVATKAAKRPFCEYHDKWYEKEKSLGGIGPAQAENAIGLLETGEYLSFGKSLHQKTLVPGVEFFIEQCVGCQKSNAILTIKAVKRSSKGKIERSVLGKQIIAPSQGEQILESVYAQNQN